MRLNLMKNCLLISCCFLIGSPLLVAQEGAEEEAAPARAAGRRANRGSRGDDRMMGLVPLLRIETVREELGVDDEQSKALESVSLEIREDFGEQIRGLLQGLRDLTPEEQRANRQEGNKEMTGIRKKINERLKGVLGDKKFRRLEEIEVQRQVRTSGIGSLASGDIATALDLTFNQKEQLREQAGTGRRRREAISLDDARAQVKEVLTAEQMEKLDTLFGADFDLPKELLEQAQGQGRGQGRGRRGRGQDGEQPARGRNRPGRGGDQPASDGADSE